MDGGWLLCLVPDGSHMRLVRFGMAFIDHGHDKHKVARWQDPILLLCFTFWVRSFLIVPELWARDEFGVVPSRNLNLTKSSYNFQLLSIHPVVSYETNCKHSIATDGVIFSSLFSLHKSMWSFRRIFLFSWQRRSIIYLTMFLFFSWSLCKLKTSCHTRGDLERYGINRRWAYVQRRFMVGCGVGGAGLDRGGLFLIGVEMSEWAIISVVEGWTMRMWCVEKKWRGGTRGVYGSGWDAGEVWGVVGSGCWR